MNLTLVAKMTFTLSAFLRQDMAKVALLALEAASTCFFEALCSTTVTLYLWHNELPFSFYIKKSRLSRSCTTARVGDWYCRTTPADVKFSLAPVPSPFVCLQALEIVQQPPILQGLSPRAAEASVRDRDEPSLCL